MRGSHNRVWFQRRQSQFCQLAGHRAVQVRRYADVTL